MKLLNRLALMATGFCMAGWAIMAAVAVLMGHSPFWYLVGFSAWCVVSAYHLTRKME